MKTKYILLNSIVAKTLRFSALFGLSLSAMPGLTQTVYQYDAIPPSLAENSAPLIMLAMSVDHQLFYKAYTDYEDVDGDGTTDTTYKNDIEYAGYFDASLCYLYVEANGRFEPSSIITPIAVDAYGEITERGYCNVSGNAEWSGNFLNWASMTRIDEVRSILYGGLRYDEDPLATTPAVLERSYLPNDAHSFAKYYIGDDLWQLTPFGNLDVSDPDDETHGLTLCNTTRHAGTDLSQDVPDSPLIRAVAGNYSLWNANERAQCLYDEERGATNRNDPARTGIFAHSENPSTGDRAEQANGYTATADYVARVVVCDDRYNKLEISEGDSVDRNIYSTHDCKEYPRGNLKPIGLLQEFGEDDSAIWGLVSGSYNRNKSGGVLRKDIGSIADEIEEDTTGAFSTRPTDGGIIAAINALRIANYSVDDTYRYNTNDNCSWGINSFTDGNCTNWGNPFAEIMQECYSYFSGGSPNANFNTDDTGLFSDLVTDGTWENPQVEATACAALNVIAFNSSSVSYDADQLASSATVSGFTDDVGVGEGISGGSYFVGENGAASPDQLCSGKTIGDFSDVRGSCPDSPRLSGSYQVAGLAYEAHTTDQRPLLSGNQYVTTWGVDLAPGIPNVRVQVPGSTDYVSILPACQNSSVGGNCGLVDFKIVNQEDDGTTARGSFYVNWEDSEQGGDYDQDMPGVLHYVLTATNITITTQVFAQSTGNRMGFGYVISGTTTDGFHVHSGINDFVYNSPFASAQDCSTGSLCDCRADTGHGACDTSIAAARSQTLTLGASSTSLLESPLYYAAKWGGFTDSDDSVTPNVDTEWDDDGDGTPDNYVLAINPVELKERMRELVIQILERTASGTAAAVNAQTGSGEGAIYQALYTPRIKETGSDLITWAGSLRGFFIDEYSRIRQNTEGLDADGNATLDADDLQIQFSYDPDEKQTFIQPYVANADGSTGDPVVDGATEISDSTAALPLWDAQQQLAGIVDYTANRGSYGTAANNGRYIFTAFDRDLDGQVIAPTEANLNPGQSATDDGLHPFIASNFSLTGDTVNDFRYLGLGDTATQADVDNLINYIRGDETIVGARNRTLGGEKLLLGDIVHSTPAVVARPNSRYDITYRDETYREFVETYEDRRSVVYVGANDGMLHAFNGGFYNAQTSTFQRTMNGETAHPLGAELWAYVPFNLLPHLQWLPEPDYPHVYYVDGPVQTFDVNIFTPSATHPHGWGTILVVGMRFGGGDYSFDHDDDINTPDITTRSAYIVMDVTDPESPPELIAEITDVDLGFTLSQPDVIKSRKRDSSGEFSGTSHNEWYLVFGSGPAGDDEAERLAALDNGVSAKSPKVYAFNLSSHSLEKIEVQDEIADPEVDSFVGGFAGVDWDLDYSDDATYYGLVAGDATTPAGKLKRARLDFNAASGVLNVNAADFSTDLFNDFSLAFSATPRTVRSANNEWWIYAGTGRFLVPDDNLSNQQQYFFGIKEMTAGDGSRSLSNPVDIASMVDTTEIDVYEDGRVRESSGGANSLVELSTLLGADTTIGTFGEVRRFIDEYAYGWYFAFETPPHDLNNLIRNTTRSAQAGESIVITAYEATNEVCDVTGRPYIYAPHIETGIPAPFAPLGTDSRHYLDNEPGEPEAQFELVVQGKLPDGDSYGMPSEPVIVPTSTTDCDSFNVFMQTTTGEIGDTLLNCEGLPSGRQSWREIPITW